MNKPIAIKGIGHFYNPFDVTRNLNSDKQTLFCSYKLIATISAAQATQNNKTANIIHKECQALYVCTINKIDLSDCANEHINLDLPFSYLR